MNLDANVACALVLKLRRFNGKAFAGPHVAASNSVDDGMDAALRQSNDDGVIADIEGLVAALNVDERKDLLGLMMWGRRPREYANFDEARLATDRADAPRLEEMVNEQLAADHLRSGLDAAGIVCEGLGDATRAVEGRTR